MTLLGAAAFSYLFYRQNAGINFLVFDLVVIAFLLYQNPSNLRKRNWLLAVLMCLVSGLAIVQTSTALAVLANMFGLMLLSAYSAQQRGSSVFSLFFSGYSLIASPLHLFTDLSGRSSGLQGNASREAKRYRYFTLLLTVLLTLLFFVLYRQSNPLFAENTNWLNFEFISFPWFVFTVFGFFVLYGLLAYRTIYFVEEVEERLVNSPRVAEQDRTGNYETEISSGLILLAVLNLMLLLLNVGDLRTLLFNGGLPEGLSHSDFVHNGVTLVMLSIVLAIGLIIFLTRRDFTNLKRFETLKWCIYLWIFQNIWMLVSTAYRNSIYIETYQLTEMRIGVYAWLLLAAVGLVLTFVKVRTNRSAWYLVQSNVTTWLTFLTLSSCLNWHLLITGYNLQHKKLGQVDLDYLFSLSEANIPQLLELKRSPAFKKMEADTSREALQFCLHYHRRLGSKIRVYMRRYECGWQSWDRVEQSVMTAVKQEYTLQY